MPRPIRITALMKETVQAEITELLADVKLSDGTINYTKSFKYKEATATLWLSPTTYRKAVALVTEFSDEVAWHGTAARVSKNEFIINDIFVYPQEVTGSTVSTDQEGYTKWLYEFDDDVFNVIRMQGHSHVNMGVSPSGVDSGHREQILGQLDDDMFYIFMIWNKRLEIHTLIYDMENNILYEDDDISVKIVGDDSLDVFLEDARQKIQKKSFSIAVGKKSGNGAREEPDCWWNFFNEHDGYDPYKSYEL